MNHLTVIDGDEHLASIIDLDTYRNARAGIPTIPRPPEGDAA